MRKFRRWLGASNWMSEHDDITTIEEIVMHVGLWLQCFPNGMCMVPGRVPVHATGSLAVFCKLVDRQQTALLSSTAQAP